MTQPVAWHPEARSEFAEARAWYAAARPGLGDDLVDAVLTAVQRIEEGETGSPHPIVPRARRIFPKRFPYAVVFVVGTPTMIVAVAHQSRHPTYWRARVR